MPGYPDQPGYPDHRHPPPPHATYSYSTIETPASDVGDAERLPPAGPMGASPWQMLNAASWHYSARDVRVKPSVSHLTSLTDPEYTSLWPIYELPVHERRLSNLSNEDLKTFIGRLENNIKHWHEPDNQNKDYLGIVDVIVDRTAGRLARMQARLESETPSETIERIEAEAFDILFPYLDIPRTMGGNGERPDARTRHEAIEQALKSCSHAYTGNWQIRSESSADNVLSNAIEGVLHRICAVSGSILEESLSMQVRSMSDGMRVRYQLKTAERWQRRINNLVEWLDWPVWKTCKNACSSDVSGIRYPHL